MQRQLEERERRLAEGATSLGWKLAFSAPAVMEELGIEGPLVGFLTDRTELHDGAEVSLSAWSRAALEPELGIQMATDLPAGASHHEAEAAIAGLAMAIELADVDVPRTEVEQVLARDIYHRHVMFGPVDRLRAGADVGEIAASVWRNGELEASTEDPEAAVGNLVDLTRYVADFLASFGGRLQAGDWIICGAIVPLIWVSPGDRIRYRSQLGELTVSFAD